MMVEQDKKTDSELDHELTKLRKAAEPYKKASKILFIATWFFMVVAVFMVVKNDANPFVVAALLTLMIIGCFVLSKIEEHHKVKLAVALQKNDFLTDILKEYFTDFSHDRNKHISEAKIRDSKLFGKYNKFYGNDYIVGKYKGQRFEFSDIRLLNVKNSGGSEEGGGTRYEAVIFSGLWLILPLKQIVQGRLTIKEKLGRNIRADVFEERYEIKTKNLNESLSVLSSDFKTQIIALNDKLHGQLFLDFKGNELCVTIHNSHDNFEINTYQAENVALIRSRFHRETMYIIDILEVLIQNNM